jgi:hypothetical protein
MELRFFYVRDKSPVAHHWDYLRNRPDHALCGHGFEDPVALGEVSRPRAVCRACQARLPTAEAQWWRETAEEAAAELEELWADYEKLWTDYERVWAEYGKLAADYERLEKHADNQRREIRKLHKKGHPTKKPSRPRVTTGLSPRVAAPVKKRPRKPPPIKVFLGGHPGSGKRR